VTLTATTANTSLTHHNETTKQAEQPITVHRRTSVRILCRRVMLRCSW